MNIAEQIRKNRKKQKLTQVELAQKAGIAVNTLRLYEAGKHQPRLEQLRRITDALNIPLSAITEPELVSDDYDDCADPPDNMPSVRDMRLYPTAKGTTILCLTNSDDTVYIMTNYPVTPATEAGGWKLSAEDAEVIEAIVAAYFSKTSAPNFSPEIGAGILLMLDRLAKKSRRLAGLSTEQPESNADVQNP